MLVPVFVKDGANTPYVQSMDEFYDVEDFFPYYQYEHFSFVSESLLIESEIGRAGLVAFRTPLNGNVWCGDVIEAVQYLNLHAAELDGTPLLKLQLLRTSNAPLAQQYEAWREVSEAYFKSPQQRARWLDAELLSYQNEDKIWERINSKKKQAKRPLVADRMESVDPEYRFSILSDPQTFECFDWELEWFKLKDQLPTDERVFALANDWLYSTFASNLEIGRTKNVLAETLRFWRIKPGQ